MEPEKNTNQNKQKGPLYLDTNLIIVFSITLINVMGMTAITPAFPMIVQELRISPDVVGLLIAVYTIPGIIFIPLAGVLADRFGRKRILVPSLMLFGIAGTACAFTRDFNLLLVLRFFHGVGAAPLFSLCLTIIGDLYPGKECATAMGYDMSVINISMAIFPTIGGAMAMLGWYYPFLLSFIAIPVGLIIFIYLKNPEPKKERSLNEYLGGVFQSIKNLQFVWLSLAAIAAMIVLFGTHFTYFPLLTGNSFGASPLTIGLIMSSMSVAGAITSSQIGNLLKFSSEKSLLIYSFILFALALFIIPFVPNLWLLLVPTMIFGIAFGMNDPSRITLLAFLAPGKQRAAFMSITQTVVRFGQTLGPVLMGIIFVTGGINSVFYFGAVLSLVMFALAAVTIK